MDVPLIGESPLTFKIHHVCNNDQDRYLYQHIRAAATPMKTVHYVSIIMTQI